MELETAKQILEEVSHFYRYYYRIIFPTRTSLSCAKNGTRARVYC